MAFGRGPKIVKDGLVLMLDAANPKSYPGTGTTWYDLSGNGYNGTLRNSPTFTTDNGGSLVLDGTNQDITITNNSDLQLSPSHTIEYAMNMDTIAGTFRGTVMKGSFTSSYGHLINPTNNKLLIYLDSDNSVEHTSTTVFSINTWYHVVTTFDSGVSTLYVNGTLDNSVSSLTLTTNTSVLTIGSNNNGSNYFVDGKIPFVKLYNRALSSDEVLQNYNALKGRFGL